MVNPRRGEIWTVDLGTPIGHEAGNKRPGLVVSDDPANTYGLAVICPLTRTRHGWPSHVEVEPGATGVRSISYIQTEQPRTVSTQRLVRRLGTLDATVMAAVDKRLKFLLGL